MQISNYYHYPFLSKLIVFTVSEYENICIAGPHSRAGYRRYPTDNKLCERILISAYNKLVQVGHSVNDEAKNTLNLCTYSVSIVIPGRLFCFWMLRGCGKIFGTDA